MQRINLVGKTFGRLVVEEFAGVEKGSCCFVCRCQCGVRKVIKGEYLRNGNTTSCGCRRRENAREVGRKTCTHGKHQSRVYRCWRNIIDRCTNERLKSYPSYGGRGISVCKRWLEFANFYSDMGDPPPDASIDRIDNDGDYTPTNCRWATRGQQARNRRNTLMVEWKGEQRLLVEICDELGINYYTAYARLTKYKLPIEEVLRSGGNSFFKDKNPRVKLITFHGETRSMTDWANSLGLTCATLSYRLKNGWTLEEALTPPVRGK